MLVQVKWKALELCSEVLRLTLLLLDSPWLIRSIKEMKVDCKEWLDSLSLFVIPS